MTNVQNNFAKERKKNYCERRRIFKQIFLFFMAFFSFTFSLFSQEKYGLKNFQITVFGTSNLHDWEAKVTKAKGHCDCANDNFREVFVAIESNSLQTEHSAMTKKITELLKAEKYPEITFQSAEIKAFEKNKDFIKLSVTGSMRIAGVSKKVDIEVICKQKSGDSFEAKLSFRLKMSDFGIEPPRAMLGALKTADEIKIDCVMFFNKP